MLAGTGHRPDKLGGYSNTQTLDHFAYYLLQHLQPEKVISGMALGWDQSLALAAVQLGIPFIAAIPCPGQESRWPESGQQRYRALLGHASEQIVIATEYSPKAMMDRNRWMVDQLVGPQDYLLALWNGTSGGTKNCHDYAQKKQIHILNAWPHWEAFQLEAQ